MTSTLDIKLQNGIYYVNDITAKLKQITILKAIRQLRKIEPSQYTIWGAHFDSLPTEQIYSIRIFRSETNYIFELTTVEKSSTYIAKNYLDAVRSVRKLVLLLVEAPILTTQPVNPHIEPISR